MPELAAAPESRAALCTPPTRPCSPALPPATRHPRPQGSLRAALDAGVLRDASTGATHLPVAIGLAHHVACAMLHLHSDGILHGDLKV